MTDMSLIDSRFGFAPWEDVKHATLYPVVTATSTAMFVGDLVQKGDAIAATRYCGTRMQALQCTTGGSGAAIGAIIGCYDKNMKPCLYIATSEAGDSVVAGYVMVADDPDQLYSVQEDGDTTSLNIYAVALNAAAIATHAGSTGTGLSGMEIDSSTAATGAGTAVTLPIRILFAHPEDTVGSGTTAGNRARWIVKVNASVYNDDAVTT